MFENSFRVTTPNPKVPIAEEEEPIKPDATITAAEIIDGVKTNFVSNNGFSQYYEQLETKLNNIYTAIEDINQKLNSENTTPQGYKKFDNPRPLLDNQNSEDSFINSNFVLDRDVIMKNNFFAPLNQVPEPGFFSGKTSETELLFQLCEDTFRTTPNKYLPEEIKINFVKSRLRDLARNWYLTKYRGNIKPGSMYELLTGLKATFSNVTSSKLAKIKK
ncbi:hypothetical protein BCR32DRAFT_325415 [Anaeromyces robustus]|uniref:Uncharacterized protein n=1 Tax=Anaeromyces robustus TaxID=1754192 RepID=A0A1Y1XI88_9FUNG|nr:hypothetical protein BCR32DRAFT_325415 [Anaeromyces robustus]|eukprot:ORX85453.1 hypothetical protein BCR32DRAFT_325415 [Anaeromyces robustus]